LKISKKCLLKGRIFLAVLFTYIIATGCDPIPLSTEMFALSPEESKVTGNVTGEEGGQVYNGFVKLSYPSTVSWIEGGFAVGSGSGDSWEPVSNCAVCSCETLPNNNIKCGFHALYNGPSLFELGLTPQENLKWRFTINNCSDEPTTADYTFSEYQFSEKYNYLSANMTLSIENTCSEQCEQVPPRPTSLQGIAEVDPGVTRIVLSWNTVNEDNVDTYEIFRMWDTWSYAGEIAHASCSISSCQFVDDDVVGGQDYKYKVIARNTSDDGTICRSEPSAETPDIQAAEPGWVGDGDADGDGDCDENDFVHVLENYVLDYSVPTNFDLLHLDVAPNCSPDGIINIADANFMAYNYYNWDLLGYEGPIPCENSSSTASVFQSSATYSSASLTRYIGDINGDGFAVDMEDYRLAVEYFFNDITPPNISCFDVAPIAPGDDYCGDGQGQADNCLYADENGCNVVDRDYVFDMADVAVLFEAALGRIKLPCTPCSL